MQKYPTSFIGLANSNGGVPRPNSFCKLLFSVPSRPINPILTGGGGGGGVLTLQTPEGDGGGVGV